MKNILLKNVRFYALALIFALAGASVFPVDDKKTVSENAVVELSQGRDTSQAVKNKYIDEEIIRELNKRVLEGKANQFEVFKMQKEIAELEKKTREQELKNREQELINLRAANPSFARKLVDVALWYGVPGLVGAYLVWRFGPGAMQRVLDKLGYQRASEIVHSVFPPNQNATRIMTQDEVFENIEETDTKCVQALEDYKNEYERVFDEQVAKKVAQIVQENPKLDSQVINNVVVKVSAEIKNELKKDLVEFEQARNPAPESVQKTMTRKDEFQMGVDVLKDLSSAVLVKGVPFLSDAISNGWAKLKNCW